MSIDKFGRYITTDNIWKKRGGSPLTSDGEYEDKRFRSANTPTSENDVATKAYVLQNAIKKNSIGNYDFNDKALTNVKDPIDSSDVVTLRHVKRFCLHRGYNARPTQFINVLTKDDLEKRTLREDLLAEHYDAETRVIRNLANPLLSKDAATKEYVDKLHGEHTEEFNRTMEYPEHQRQLKNLGKALFTYIHRLTGKSAEASVDGSNYLNWDEIFQG